MIDQLTKAYVNLNGVLRSLEYLCYFDNEAHALIFSKNMIIQFEVKNGPTARLTFKNGQCVFQKGRGRCHIKLWFSSPEHFNDMVDGKAKPIIRKGFTKIGFLTNDFALLTKKLEYYLKPTPELLNDTDYQMMNTILSFYTAFNSLAEIGMHDPVGKTILSKNNHSVFCANISDTEYQVRLKASPGRIEILDKPDGSPEMHLIFKNLETANETLNGKKDFLTAIGLGEIQLQGFLPNMPSLENVLPLLSVYLK